MLLFPNNNCYRAVIRGFNKIHLYSVTFPTLHYKSRRYVLLLLITKTPKIFYIEYYCHICHGAFVIYLKILNKIKWIICNIICPHQVSRLQLLFIPSHPSFPVFFNIVMATVLIFALVHRLPNLFARLFWQISLILVVSSCNSARFLLPVIELSFLTILSLFKLPTFLSSSFIKNINAMLIINVCLLESFSFIILSPL